MFEANGAGSELSHAQVFAKGQYPVVGRFNLGTPDPNADDAKERVRGLGVMISTPDGQEWRMAMIDPPFFPVASREAFRELQIASASKEPDAMAKFAGAHPEIAAFGGWAKSAPWTGSYAEEPYNGLNSFIFTDGSGNDHAVRWSLMPAAQPVPVPPEELAKRGPNFLETEITDRIKSGPARWTMKVTVANAGDQTSDPSKAWPQDRRSVEVGTLTVQTRSKPRRTARAATSISIRPSCRTAYGRRTIRSPPPARPPTGSPTTAARPRRKTTREPPREPPNDERSADPPVTLRRFTPLQRALHWVMAVCILAMLFIGVGMVSTVAPEYLTLVNIHKPLGIPILILALIRLVVRLRYGAPPLPLDLPEPMKLAALSLALRALRADDRHAADRLGDAVGRGLSRRVVAERLAAADRAAKREPAYALVERAFLSRLRVLRADPDASRRGSVPCAGPARRRVRCDGAEIDA